MRLRENALKVGEGKSRDKIYIVWIKVIPLKKDIKWEAGILVVDKGTFRLLDVLKIRKGEDEYPMSLAVEIVSKKPLFYFAVAVKDKPTIVTEYREGRCERTRVGT